MNTVTIPPRRMVNLARTLARVQQEQRNCQEHRKQERYLFSGRLLVGRVEKSGTWVRVSEGHCLDLSSNGIGFLTETPLAVGDVFTFELTAPAGEDWQIPGRIMHCTSVLNHTFRAGAQFLMD